MNKPDKPAKITRPRLSGITARRRLFRLLDQARSRPVIWIAAQAGSGKTTLAASYLDSRKLPCLWYQADQGDGDIATFFYYMGMAAKQAAPRHKQPMPLLTPEYLMGIPVFTRRYFEELYRRLKRPCVIVLDNYQEVPSDSGFHDMLVNGFDVIPEGVTILVLSRTDPPRQFARLSANNNLRQIGWTDIRFTREESGALMKAQGRRNAVKDAVDLLHSKTEGWAAGLMLLMEADTALDFPASGPASPASLFDYFANEIFSKADAPMQDVLLRTSFLRRIEASDAEHLTGNKTAGQILEHLSRHHYFTQKYDRAYQYHPLFQEFLLARAGNAFSRTERALIRRKAAELLINSGQAEDAVPLLRDAEDWEGLTKLVLSRAQTLTMQGRSHTLESWITALPPDIPANVPWLQYWRGMCRLAYNPVEARRYFEEAFLCFKKEDDAPGLYLSWACIVDTFLYEWGDARPLDHWIEVAGDIIARHPMFPSPEIEARFTAGMLNALTWRQPSHPGVSTWADKAWRMLLQHTDNQLRMMLGNHLVLYHIWYRDFAKAALAIEVLRSVSGSDENNRLMQLHWLGMVSIHAWVSADLEACLQAVRNSLRIAEESGIHLLDLAALAQGVFGGVTLGDPATASDCLARMSKINSPRIMDQALYHSQEGLLAWHHGDFKKAIERGLLSVKLIDITGVPMSCAIAYIELAVSLFDGGRHQEAKEVLARAAESARGVHALEFTSLLHGARFALDLGEEEEGLRLLRQGLTLGAHEGYVNMYRWNDGVMSRLCAKALEHGIEPSYVQGLIHKRHLEPPEYAPDIDNWPYPVRITTLGRFEVLLGDQPLRFGGKVQKKPLDLLKVLIAFSGEAPEQRISEALWPDADGDSGHRSFESALYRLRKLIGDKALRLHDGVLELDRRSCWVDAWEFQRLARIGKTASDDRSETNRRFDKSIRLYRGNFLPHDMHQSWSLSLRERLKSDYIGLVTACGRSWEYAREWEQAIACFRKGLETEELAEEFYQHLMLCHIQLGEHVQAESVYRRCCMVLKHTLGLTPSPRTVELYASIRKHVK